MENTFPKWRPLEKTLRKLSSRDKRVRFKALYNASRGFITRKDVREYIFSRDGYKCVLCGKTTDLTIDHIRSIYRVAMNGEDYTEFNSESNLRTLCRSCNSSKHPEE